VYACCTRMSLLSFADTVAITRSKLQLNKPMCMKRRQRERETEEVV
jgi:hypothetical protein